MRERSPRRSSTRASCFRRHGRLSSADAAVLHSVGANLPDVPRGSMSITQNVGFPQSYDGPPNHSKPLCLLPVPLPVPRDLGDPIIGVVPAQQGFSESRPVTTVPEIPVAKHGDPRSGEDNIWLARQRDDMCTIA